jgi:hypothetical protein
MASKFDKETLKKNLFWILQGVYVVFWLVAIVIALVPGKDDAAKAYAKAKKDVDDTKGKNVKTAAYQEPWNVHGTKFREYKDKIWAKAWKQQERMYEWPKRMLAVARPEYPDVPFAHDAAGKENVTEDRSIRSRFPDWYHEQFEDLPRIVYPAKFNGGFDAVFPEQKWVKGNAPTQEEIWLAQEDFWVKRELLYLIQQAIASVALFREQPAAKDEKPPEGVVARRVFRNANWELTLLIEKAPTGKGLVLSERSTIKNINIDERTQVLANSAATSGLPFRFQQVDTSYYQEFRISGEPLPFEKESPISTGKISVAPVDLNKPFIIEQILDWEISPVRRVDKIELARHSHRTVTGGLKPNLALKPKEIVETPDPAAEKDKEPQGGRPTGMQGGGPGAPPGPNGAPGGSKGGAAAVADITTPNGIPRDRYLHVTPQARHLPVVVRLVVDQAHIHDILASISNSRLRMQITQVSFHHVSDVTRASLEAPAAGGNTPAGTRPGGPPTSGIPPARTPPAEMRPPADGNRPPAPPMGMKMPQMPGSGPSSGGGRMLFGGPRDGDGGSGRPAAGVAAKSTARTLDNARLVELSIYAIASLYDRFPPRPKETVTPVVPPVAPVGKN